MGHPLWDANLGHNKRIALIRSGGERTVAICKLRYELAQMQRTGLA